MAGLRRSVMLNPSQIPEQTASLLESNMLLHSSKAKSNISPRCHCSQAIACSLVGRKFLMRLDSSENNQDDIAWNPLWHHLWEVPYETWWLGVWPRWHCTKSIMASFCVRKERAFSWDFKACWVEVCLLMRQTIVSMDNVSQSHQCGRCGIDETLLYLSFVPIILSWPWQCYHDDPSMVLPFTQQRFTAKNQVECRNNFIKTKRSFHREPTHTLRPTHARTSWSRTWNVHMRYARWLRTPCLPAVQRAQPGPKRSIICCTRRRTRRPLH